MSGDVMKDLSDWVQLGDVAALVEKATGHRPCRATIYVWASTGKLRVADYRPLRTRRSWVLEFLNKHKKGIQL